MRLFFDECCSRRLAVELREFFELDYPEIQTEHILDKFHSGALDPDWLAGIKEDDTCVVVTQDLGREASNKLPLICRKLKITHIGFSSVIIHGGYSLQKRALVAVWPFLKSVQRLERGTQVRLGLHVSKGGAERFALLLKADGGWKPL